MMKRLWKKASSLVRGGVSAGLAHATEIQVTNSISLDPGVLSPGDDGFDRHRLAENIYELARDQATLGSVRIGLDAEWGYGKSVIANWVASLAENNRDIVVAFSPWAANDEATLWITFALRLEEVLRKHKIALPDSLASKLLVARTKSAYKELFSASPRIAEGIAATVARFSSADIRALRELLGSRRVIILLDDLDRAEPAIIPSLLMHIRELLDIPGFVFLLPFDKALVGNSLTARFGALQGDVFLEKILDYQITIPPTTTQQRWTFFCKECATTIPGIEITELSDCAELLPDNPRRVRRIAHSLKLIFPELKRQRGDIDLLSAFLAVLLRTESEKFYREYTNVTYRAQKRIKAEEYNIGEDSEKQFTERVDRILRSQNITGHVANRCRLISQKWEDKRPAALLWMVEHTLDALETPVCFSSAEIDLIVAGGIRSIPESIEKASEKYRKSQLLVSDELISLLQKRYRFYLANAAKSLTRAQHGQCLDKAREVRVLIQEFVDGAVESSGRSRIKMTAFSSLLLTYRRWSHIRMNPADIVAREAEEAVLKAFATDLRSEWSKALMVIDPTEFEHEEEKPYRDFLKELRSIYDQDVINYITSSFGGHQAETDIFGAESARYIGDIFCNPDGGVWTPGSSLFNQLSTASYNENVQISARRILELAFGQHHTLLRYDRNKLKSLVATERVGIALWNAVVASELQFRYLQSTSKMREALAAGGLPTESLQLPKWLEPHASGHAVPVGTVVSG